MRLFKKGDGENGVSCKMGAIDNGMYNNCSFFC